MGSSPADADSSRSYAGAEEYDFDIQEKDMKTPVKKYLLVLGLVTAAVMGIDAHHAADAHDALVKSTPANGSVIPASPETIALKFSGKPAAVIVHLLGGEGEEIADVLGEPMIDGKSINIPVTGPMRDGDYRLTFRISSRDAHTVEGAIKFTVQHAEPAAQ